MHLSGSVTILYLNKAMNSQIYKKWNWQCASAELTTCTACLEGCRAGLRALLHALCHYTLQVKITLADFNSAVSTQTAKPPNLILRHIFQLYSRSEFYAVWRKIRARKRYIKSLAPVPKNKRSCFSQNERSPVQLPLDHTFTIQKYMLHTKVEDGLPL